MILIVLQVIINYIQVYNLTFQVNLASFSEFFIYNETNESSEKDISNIPTSWIKKLRFNNLPHITKCSSSKELFMVTDLNKCGRADQKRWTSSKTCHFPEVYIAITTFTTAFLYCTAWKYIIGAQYSAPK